jgi:hypothetical protein
MIKILFSLILLIFFTACSFQTPKNNWQYKSSSIFDSYVNNYLSENKFLAKSDLKRATRYASKGEDLSHLAKIYLGECALKISVSKENVCLKYKKIRTLLNDKNIDAYYLFITRQISIEEVEYLPKQYQEFSNTLLKEEFIIANKSLREIQPTTSKLLAGSLLKDNIDTKSIQHILDEASFNGYKKAVVFWLEQLKNRTEQLEEKQKISQKIELLQSIE